MTTVAVIVRAGKTFGGGLDELRRVLADAGFPDPLWYEVTKSRQVGEYSRRAVTKGADVLFVWGGDGTVEIGLHGDRRILDTGTVNGEHFAVMAGAGLDALMIRDADDGLKDRFGRAAYLWTAAKNLKQWVSTVVLGRSDDSPFVFTTRGKRMRVIFSKPTPYELDGDLRKATKQLRIKVKPKSITVCVPALASAGAEGTR